MTTPSARPRLLLLTLAVAAACGGEASRNSDEPGADSPASAQPASTASEAGREGVAGTEIRTTNGAVVMALRDDRVVVHLSDSLVGKVRSAFDSGAARDSSSLGGRIARMAQSAVGDVLARPVEYPLDEIEDVSYDGEAIRFDFRGNDKRLIETTKVDDRPLLQSFAPEDARRFVEAVRAAKAGRAAR